MAERTSEGQRITFYQRHVCGETYARIAQTSGRSLECVRYWCRKQQQGQGVKSRWHQPVRGVLSQFHLKVMEQVRQLRQQHPGWGPISLRLHLEDATDLRGKRLPSPATIGRFLHQDLANRRTHKTKPPEPPAVSLTQAHQRWEMDFKVKIHLGGGEIVQLHTVTDPFSGAHLGAYLYAVPSDLSRVPLRDVQATLRACFSEWRTLPEEIQTDGEGILTATPGELPTAFTLWLTGLGIVHRRIRPGRPTDNGSVERGHRTHQAYCLQGQLQRSLPDLQAYLQTCRMELNTRYPSRAKGCGGQPPLVVHPELLQPLRRYDPAYEEVLFDPSKVDALLAACPLERKVGKMGQITIGGAHACYQVGHVFAQQVVQIRFDPARRDYVAYLPDDTGTLQEIKRWRARNLDVHHLLWPDDPCPSQCPQQLPLPLRWSTLPLKTEHEVNC